MLGDLQDLLWELKDGDQRIYFGFQGWSCLEHLIVSLLRYPSLGLLSRRAKLESYARSESKPYPEALTYFCFRSGNIQLKKGSCIGAHE